VVGDPPPPCVRRNSPITNLTDPVGSLLNFLLQSPNLRVDDSVMRLLLRYNIFGKFHEEFLGDLDAAPERARRLQEIQDRFEFLEIIDADTRQVKLSLKQFLGIIT
jgi:hypothetical protein